MKPPKSKDGETHEEFEKRVMKPPKSKDGETHEEFEKRVMKEFTEMTVDELEEHGIWIWQATLEKGESDE